MVLIGSVISFFEIYRICSLDVAGDECEAVSLKSIMVKLACGTVILHKP
jgi:hypothetical protein